VTVASDEWLGMTCLCEEVESPQILFLRATMFDTKSRARSATLPVVEGFRTNWLREKIRELSRTVKIEWRSLILIQECPISLGHSEANAQRSRCRSKSSRIYGQSSNQRARFGRRRDQNTDSFDFMGYDRQSAWVALTSTRCTIRVLYSNEWQARGSSTYPFSTRTRWNRSSRRISRKVLSS
jgi:hypothetical protein